MGAEGDGRRLQQFDRPENGEQIDIIIIWNLEHERSIKPGLLAFLVAHWVQHKAHIMFDVKSCQPVGLGYLMLSQSQAHFARILQAAQDSAQWKHLSDGAGY